jgi:hypothetical protein
MRSQEFNNLIELPSTAAFGAQRETRTLEEPQTAFLYDRASEASFAKPRGAALG